jgi:deoxyribose-phosphate aldolase
MDQTLLKAEATADQIDELCDGAQRWGFAAICVNPIYVQQVVRRISGGKTVACSVAGFPLGATPTANKVDEARRAIDDGAVEIDMVIHIGALRSGQARAVEDDMAAVAEVVHKAGAGYVLKTILECGALAERQVVAACGLAKRAGADFVKTSTGMHSSGGATVEAVRLLCAHAQGMSVKAAGGIRTLDDALAMLGAGADRLGTSSGVAILEDLSGRAKADG